MFRFSSYNWCGYRKFPNISLLENSNSVWPRTKKKLVWELYAFYWFKENYTIKVKIKFWSVPYKIRKSPQCYQNCMKESMVSTFLIQHHSSQDLWCKVLVANNAQRCFPILPNLWQLLLNKESNTSNRMKLVTSLPIKPFMSGD
jgi:hypothetical protein